MRDSTKILCKLIFLLESFHADKGEFTIEKKKIKNSLGKPSITSCFSHLCVYYNLRHSSNAVLRCQG